MKSLKRTSGIAALALTASLGLAACSSESDDSAASDASSQTEESPASEESSDMSSDSGEMDPASQVYGPACDAIPTDGSGSLDGMATDPVATAASNNPLLKTLVKAVGAANLGDTLNGAEDITVFAPTNDAFAEIPKKDLTALLGKPKQLATVLSHHVVEGSVPPEELSGEFTTLAGDTLTINGEGEEATIGQEQATVLCGNVPTANATVYVIDKVLMPTG